MSPGATIRNIRRIEGGLGCTIDELSITENASQCNWLICRRKAGNNGHRILRGYAVLHVLIVPEKALGMKTIRVRQAFTSSIDVHHKQNTQMQI